MKTKREIITDKDLPPEVIRAIKEGKKIEAIKLLQQSTGLGLANAKVLVDKAWREHGTPYTPVKYVDEQTNVGKLLGTLLLVAIAFICYRYYSGA